MSYQASYAKGKYEGQVSDTPYIRTTQLSKAKDTEPCYR